MNLINPPNVKLRVGDKGTHYAQETTTKKISKLEMIMEEDLRMRTTLELRNYKLCMRVGKMEGLTEREQEDRINMILDLYQLYGNNVINLLGECIGIRWEGKPKRKSKKKKNSKKK